MRAAKGAWRIITPTPVDSKEHTHTETHTEDDAASVEIKSRKDLSLWHRSHPRRPSSSSSCRCSTWSIFTALAAPLVRDTSASHANKFSPRPQHTDSLTDSCGWLACQLLTFGSRASVH